MSLSRRRVMTRSQGEPEPRLAGGEYRSRLEAIAKRETEFEEKLKKSEERLAASQDGARYVMKHDFDLSADDWKELSKDGTIEYQMPCSR